MTAVDERPAAARGARPVVVLVSIALAWVAVIVGWASGRTHLVDHHALLGGGRVRRLPRSARSGSPGS
jgi:hypothetical protein